MVGKGGGGNPLIVTPSCYMVLILPFCHAYKFFTCLTTALTLTPGEDAACCNPVLRGFTVF